MPSRIPLYHYAGVVYFLFYFIQVNLITPVEQMLTSDKALLASLLFLPAGAKIVMFYLCRWKSVPSLIVGNLLAFYVFYVPEGSRWVSVLTSLGSALALPLMYEIACRFFGLDLFKGRHGSPHWLALLSLVGLASVINGLALSISWTSGPDIHLLLRVAFGDVMGVWVLMLLTMLILRQRRIRA